MEPAFLELGEILLIHQDQLERYGGSPGLRDIGILQSATAMPRAGIADRYLHEDIFEMAAAYLYYIVRNHPFVDGNKRTGVVAAMVFLAMNDIKILVDEDELEVIVRSVAEGNTTKANVAAFFREGKRR
ncbi:MAG: type II toxin-antitoxin system death-on-curing family toxin [Actinomycetia bacterium]|nr:type II toxin-antitoxin system death-on-curing family toxin [Actinomycetota bacterium]MBU4240807.1 type II toxin-antitoxin system death-on-curing family toxin [Actinomycetota bacterium]MCG2795130.1 type II toxin-antitoxin system death-on-curing family toxin [Actinomycetes bacterium]